jgi:hypothetical protein
MIATPTLLLFLLAAAGALILMPGPSVQPVIYGPG